MCDVAQLKGLMPRTWRDVQVVTMFHENQLTFPWSPADPDRDNGRDNTYAYVNLSTVMASDQVWFNSHHHVNVFFEAAQQWMDAMPKPHVPFRSEHAMRAKSRVMHLGLDLQGWERHRSLVTTPRQADVPTILWNHRWAWDKGSDAFLSFARDILERNIPAQFVILRTILREATRRVGRAADRPWPPMPPMGVRRVEGGLHLVALGMRHRARGAPSGIFWTERGGSDAL